MKRLILRACPRAAPLGWPHATDGEDVDLDGAHLVVYRHVYVKPDGSGWTSAYDKSLIFPEHKLDDVLEGFYQSAGSYAYDFEVLIVQPAKTSKRKKATKSKKAKRPAKRKRRTGRVTK